MPIACAYKKPGLARTTLDLRPNHSRTLGSPLASVTFFRVCRMATNPPTLRVVELSLLVVLPMRKPLTRNWLFRDCTILPSKPKGSLLLGLKPPQRSALCSFRLTQQPVPPRILVSMRPTTSCLMTSAYLLHSLDRCLLSLWETSKSHP